MEDPEASRVEVREAQHPEASRVEVHEVAFVRKLGGDLPVQIHLLKRDPVGQQYPQI